MPMVVSAFRERKTLLLTRWFNPYRRILVIISFYYFIIRNDVAWSIFSKQFSQSSHSIGVQSFILANFV